MSRHAAAPSSPWPRPASALRDVLAEGYTGAMLRADLLAGAVVGIVALPLSMALAIASGVPPQHGLYTAIVAGGVIALLGGSRFQVSGPTAAFVVVLSPIAHRFGVGGLALATLMAGLMLFAMGVLRMGRLIEFVPYPVTTGFTAGIAVVIATLQLKDLLGLSVREMPEHFVERVQAIAQALPTARASDLSIGLLTLVVLAGWPRVTRRIPAPLVALRGGRPRRRGSPMRCCRASRWPRSRAASSTTCAASRATGFPRCRRCRSCPGRSRGRTGARSACRSRWCASSCRRRSRSRCSARSSRCCRRSWPTA